MPEVTPSRGKTPNFALVPRPESWRSDLLELVLRFGFWIGAVTYVPSAWAAIHFQEPVVLVVDTVAMGILSFLAWSKKLSQSNRARIFCGIMYALGCLLLLRVGTIGQIYLFAASLFATLLLGRQAGLVSVVGNFVSMISLGFVSFAAPAIVSAGARMNPSSWAVQTLNFSFLNLVLTLAVAAVIVAIESALAEALKAQDELRKESERLESANLALREKDEILETARKMEAVGRLAGGVAHDFNNMLNVILGHAEVALADLPEGSPLRSELEQIVRAGERSAGLTRQLLAFARKQTISPRSIDLNRQIAETLTMLRRLIGSSNELVFKPARDVTTTRIDPTQLDQILTNLTINARDAMKGGGKIIVRTARVKLGDGGEPTPPALSPGDYVSLRVSDTGAGMDAQTRERLFEPFYTTKALGVGTGLGLSTVYGIVRQNEGTIRVKTELDKGTEFEILFRYCESQDTGAEKAGTDEIPRGAGERLLLVEDEPSVLKLVELMLTRLGYQVASATNVVDAVKIARGKDELALLITDVIMPEKSGKEVAQEVLLHQPGLKCLFMSGYTADVIDDRGVLSEEIAFLQKPFSLGQLARKVRSVLDGETLSP